MTQKADHSQTEKSNRRWIMTTVKIAISIAAIAAVLAVVVPDIRQTLVEHMSENPRIVLSTADGDVIGHGELAKVVKVQTPQGLYIEIYQTSNNSLELIDRIEIENSKDGYFMFNGEASNLILEDVDRDSVVEILAPSYDSNLMAHLNIFSYDKIKNKFVKLN